MFQREYQRLEQLQADQPEQLKIPQEELKSISEKNVIDQFLFLLKAEKEVDKVDQAAFDKAYEGALSHFDEIAPPTDEQKEVMKSEIRGMLRQEAYFKELFKNITISEDMAQAEYDQNPEKFIVPDRVHCSHIVRHTVGEGVDPNQALKEIMDAQNDLAKGLSFEEAIEKYSDEKGQGGDMGTFVKGQMIEKFENVVFSLKPDEVSEVFQTDFGYHIARVHEKFEPKQLTFDEVKMDLMKQMGDSQRDEVVQRVLGELKAEAEIEE